MCHITGLGAVFGIGGDKTTCIGVVVTSIEVVETEFCIVVVPTIAEGIECGGEVGASAFSNSILPHRAGCQPPAKSGGEGDQIIVGAGGLAAARSRSGSDNTPVLSFKTLTPLRYPDCPHPELTKYGQIADRYIKQLHDFYPHLSVEEYVIMPNHIHLLLWVKENENAIENGQSRTPVPTNIERANSVCSQFVSTFKRFCNKEYGENIWQARFYDHVIRNREDYEEHARYIRDNPDRWYYDELYQAE